MSERKLVSVQEITGIHPIKDADRIEIARVLGWVVVVGKDMHLKVGDHVAYFETDCLLPDTDPVYAPFQSRGQKTITVTPEGAGGLSMEVKGHVLRTMKLRGVWSQGLIMRLDELGIDPDTPVGTDITRQAGVYKYEEPLPANTGKVIGRYDAPCSKSDAPRAQTLTDYWSELVALEAMPTVKADGTSTTLYRDGNGELHVYSRNWEIGKESTNMLVAEQTGLADALDVSMVVQFELCGPGINGNRLKLSKPQPFVFAVWRDRRKLDREDWPQTMLDHAAPALDEREWGLTGSLDDMIGKVNGIRGHITKDVLDEGIVWHIKAGQRLSDGLAEALGANRCFKIISNKYLLKHGL